MKRHAPLVISLVALFAALGGSSYASTQIARNSVGSAQIRNGTIRARDLAPALHRLVLATPSASPAGAGVATRIVEQSSAVAHAGDHLGVRAYCPAGHVIVGGGGQVWTVREHPADTLPDSNVEGSFPFAQGWEFNARLIGSGAAYVTAYAICAVESPDASS